MDGWKIVRAEDTEWLPWTGSADEARAKTLGTADGYTVVFVEAQPGLPRLALRAHVPEFSHVVEGSVRDQGRQLSAGDATRPPVRAMTTSPPTPAPPTSSSSRSERR
jgi:hypothetical protein